jgi:hypothetical protein
MRLEAKTKLPPRKVMALARTFFGEELGLTEAQADADMAVFVGGGGGTAVGTHREGRTTTVELLSREWDHEAKQFIGKLKPEQAR